MYSVNPSTTVLLLFRVGGAYASVGCVGVVIGVTARLKTSMQYLVG